MICFHVRAVLGIMLSLIVTDFGLAQTFDSVASQVVAQTISPVTAVTGTGSASIQHPAQRLRVIIPLTEQGENVRIAAEALNREVASVKDELEALGASPRSITATSPTVVRKLPGAQGMLGAFGIAMGGFGDLDEGDAAEINGDDLVRVRSHLTAEFDLPAGDVIELMDTAFSLEQEIREAEFNGPSDGNALVGEQALLAQAMMAGESESDDSDQLVFLFLAPVTEDERAELLKTAFADARTNAEELAAAAGLTLGRISSIAIGVFDEFDPWSFAADEQVSRRHLSAQERRLTATGENPTKLELKVTLTVGFEIVP